MTAQSLAAELNPDQRRAVEYGAGDGYPPPYRDSLYLADNSRTVIFRIPLVDANADGVPDSPADNAAVAFHGGNLAKAVQLVTGPGGDLFYGLGPDAMAALATASSDIALVLCERGLVVDVAYRDRSLEAWKIDGWIGRHWNETVTTDSRDKIDDLLREGHVPLFTHGPWLRSFVVDGPRP